MNPCPPRNKNIVYRHRVSLSDDEADKTQTLPRHFPPKVFHEFW